MLLHECSITKGARELSPEYLEEIKHYHLNRAERFLCRIIISRRKKVYMVLKNNVSSHTVSCA